MSASADSSGFLRMLKRASAEHRRRAIRGMDRSGEHVIGKAAKGAAYDLGNLQRSKKTEPAEFKGNVLVKIIGFDTDYAAIVHNTWKKNLAIPAASTRERRRKRNGKFARRTGNKNPNARRYFLRDTMKEEGPRVWSYMQKAVFGG